MMPRPLADPGLFEVDGTWGAIQPFELAPGVRTVGEIEVIAHLEEGRPLVDSRRPHFYEQATIPSALNVPHPDAVARVDELDRSQPTDLLLQRPAVLGHADGRAGTARRRLSAAGGPLLPGGIYDWMTLALPVVPGGAPAA